ncbi:MAG: hypothetical protein CR972_02465 [Candidatus Moraniibacteriota bacterium]|nr:MAG: hypothetical protein CR972_02465 [Candidatus Moranbacteria bacterium]
MRMIIKNLNVYFFIFLLIVGTVAGFLLVKPYLSAIFMAALFAAFFNRPYEYLQRKLHSPAIASSLMLVVIAVGIIVPVLLVFGLVYNEVSDVVVTITEKDSVAQSFVKDTIETVENTSVFSTVFESFEGHTSGTEISDSIKNVANYFITLVQALYKGIMNSAVAIFVMFFTLFYFFIDGKKLVKKIMQISPLRDVHEKKLIDEFISMTRATLKGTVVIGFIQGTIGGIAFAVAGITSPVLWTVIMVVVAIIPAIGAGLVIFPAAIIMLLLGNVWQGIFLAVIGVFVSTIDNVLRPKLVGNDTQMHSLAVFFATIGGLQLFGILGFIIGPIIMALMIAMWKIYAIEFKQDLEKFNA